MEVCILNTNNNNLEEIFSIDKVVPVDVLLVFRHIHTITQPFIQVHFYGSQTFLCRSLLLNTTILNNTLFIFRSTRVVL